MTTLASPVLERKYTVEEYFELEKHSEIRHEYYYGKLLPMPGDSKKANLLAGSCEFHLRLQLRKKGLDFFHKGVRLLAKENTIYRYPDFVIAPVVDDSDTHLIKQPVLILEVPSDDTDHTDRVTKRDEYLALPDLQCYLIVSQAEHLVDMYLRDGNRWLFSSYKNLEDEIDFPFLGAKLRVADIYEDVTFEG